MLLKRLSCPAVYLYHCDIVQLCSAVHISTYCYESITDLQGYGNNCIANENHFLLMLLKKCLVKIPEGRL